MDRLGSPGAAATSHELSSAISIGSSLGSLGSNASSLSATARHGMSQSLHSDVALPTAAPAGTAATATVAVAPAVAAAAAPAGGGAPAAAEVAPLQAPAAQPAMAIRPPTAAAQRPQRRTSTNLLARISEAGSTYAPSEAAARGGRHPTGAKLTSTETAERAGSIQGSEEVAAQFLNVLSRSMATGLAQQPAAPVEEDSAGSAAADCNGDAATATAAQNSMPPARHQLAGAAVVAAQRDFLHSAAEAAGSSARQGTDEAAVADSVQAATPDHSASAAGQQMADSAERRASDALSRETGSTAATALVWNEVRLIYTLVKLSNVFLRVPHGCSPAIISASRTMSSRMLLS